MAGAANAFPRWPWYVTVLGLAPVGLPALLAYRGGARDFGGVALRTWPLAALAVFYAPLGTFPFHAFRGVGLPLAVLAILGIAAERSRRAAAARTTPVRLSRRTTLAIAAALLVLIVPGTAYRADQLRAAVSAGRQPFFLRTGEHDALR